MIKSTAEPGVNRKKNLLPGLAGRRCELLL